MPRGALARELPSPRRWWTSAVSHDFCQLTGASSPTHGLPRRGGVMPGCVGRGSAGVRECTQVDPN